jgi:hypothetical protein
MYRLPPLNERTVPCWHRKSYLWGGFSQYFCILHQIICITFKFVPFWQFFFYIHVFKVKQDIRSGEPRWFTRPNQLLLDRKKIGNLVVCQEQRFCPILTGTFLWKPIAGNWQINRNSRNRMSEKILSERIPLNGQWNNRTSPTWPETRHGREGKSQTIFFLQNWRNQMTEQYWTIGPEIQGFLSDRRSFYRTCPSVWLYFVFTGMWSLVVIFHLSVLLSKSWCDFSLDIPVYMIYA